MRGMRHGGPQCRPTGHEARADVVQEEVEEGGECCGPKAWRVCLGRRAESASVPMLRLTNGYGKRKIFSGMRQPLLRRCDRNTRASQEEQGLVMIARPGHGLTPGAFPTRRPTGVILHDHVLARIKSVNLPLVFSPHQQQCLSNTDLHEPTLPSTSRSWWLAGIRISTVGRRQPP